MIIMVIERPRPRRQGTIGTGLQGFANVARTVFGGAPKSNRSNIRAVRPVKPPSAIRRVRPSAAVARRPVKPGTTSAASSVAGVRKPTRSLRPVKKR